MRGLNRRRTTLSNHHGQGRLAELAEEALVPSIAAQGHLPSRDIMRLRSPHRPSDLERLCYGQVWESAGRPVRHHLHRQSARFWAPRAGRSPTMRSPEK
jgi:hypothetical protein